MARDAVTERFPVLQIDMHPEVVKAARKRQKLAEQLTTAQREDARLVAEREHLRQERHQTAVEQLSREQEPALESFDVRLGRLDVEITRAGERAAQLRDVIAQHDVTADATIATVKAEARAEIATYGRNLVGEMVPLVARLLDFNKQLYHLHDLAGRAGGVPLPMVFPPELLSNWAAHAAAFVPEKR